MSADNSFDSHLLITPLGTSCHPDLVSLSLALLLWKLTYTGNISPPLLLPREPIIYSGTSVPSEENSYLKQSDRQGAE